MKFEQLLAWVGNEPVFETGLLLAGDQDPGDVRRQLSRWVRAGKLYQLRRGLYALAPPFRKVIPHPFLVANRLVPGSYVSRHAALAYFGLIPEYVALITSVSPGRPEQLTNPLGRFDYRHLRPELITGHRWVEVSAGQRAFVASPEKALLDLIYLQPGADAPEYLAELRLGQLEVLDSDELRRLAEVFGKPKLARAVEEVVRIKEHEAEEYVVLSE